MIRLLMPVVALLVLLPTAAVADEWSYDDARRDVVEIVPGGHGEVRYVARPRDRGADITRLEVDADSRRLVVRIHVRDLVRARVKNLNVRVRTADRDLILQGYQDENDRGSVTVLDHETDEYVGCDRYPRIRFRFAPDVIRLAVPSSCLDDPAWVRVGARLGAFDEERIGFDDALGRGGFGHRSWPRVGPRVQVTALPRPEREPIPTAGGMGWLEKQRVGRRTTDGLLTLPVRGRRAVVIEAVHADFDHGVRLLAARIASPERPMGGVLGPGWPAYENVVGDTPVVDAVGARLSPTRDGRDWLLLLGYQVVRKGQHHRTSVTVDYRAGRDHYSATFAYEAIICSGPRARRTCSSDELAG